MAIHVACPECQQNYQVGEDKAGRRFRCKKCEGMIDVPLAEDDFGFSEDLPTLPARTARRKPSRSVQSMRTGEAVTSFGPNSYFATFKRFGNTDGRANRTEYWNFFLFNALFQILVLFPLAFVDRQNQDGGNLLVMICLLTMLIFVLATLAPGLAVTVRRLHDSDRSGWWLLIAFIPYVGGLLMLFFALIPGTAGSNRFGPQPG